MLYLVNSIYVKYDKIIAAPFMQFQFINSN